MDRNVRIVFMGTPAFAVASLGSLLMNGFNVVGVVTTPDKPAGRGRNLQSSEVKKFSELSYLPLLQPGDLRDSSFLSAIRNLSPDIIIVVAFRYIPAEVWSLARLGTFNLHASLLPQYRGAAPINHVLINGEQHTGVTTFLIDDRIDSGNILFREEVPIFPSENAGDLHDRLMRCGARLVIKTVRAMIDGTVSPKMQSDFIKPGEILKTAPKIYPHTSIIDWSSDPMSIHNMVRGLSPSPCARTILIRGNEHVPVKISETQPDICHHNLIPGTIETDGKHFLRIACRGGLISILSLQVAGRKRMSTVEFLNGFRADGFSAGKAV